MKHLYYIAILGGFLFTVNPAFAQEEGQSQQQTQQRDYPGPQPDPGWRRRKAMFRS